MQDPAERLPFTDFQSEIKINQKTYMDVTNSYVRLNIWFGECDNPIYEPGHVSLIIFNGVTGQLTDISFYPASDNGGLDNIWSTGRAVTYTYDKYNIDEFSTKKIEKSIKMKGKNPDFVLYFYSLDVEKMLEFWETKKNRSKYCFFASSPLNTSSYVYNCIRMANDILDSGGFNHLLLTYNKHQSYFEKTISYLPSFGGCIGLITSIGAISSSMFYFKLISYFTGGYLVGSVLGSYLYQKMTKPKVKISNFITKGTKSCSPSILSTVDFLFWRKIPNISKDLLITTPADFVSKALAAFIVEYSISTTEIRKHHDLIMKEDINSLDLIDILSFRLANDPEIVCQPSYFEGYREKFYTAIKQRNYKEVECLINYQLCNDINNINIHLDKVILIKYLNRFEDAINVCDDLIKKYPGHKNVILEKIACLRILKQEQKAYDFIKDYEGLDQDIINERDNLEYKSSQQKYLQTPIKKRCSIM